MDMPVLLQQFLHLACGLAPDQATPCGAVWRLRSAGRCSTGWSVSAVGIPDTATGDREALGFLDHLPPRTLIEAWSTG